MNLLPGIQGECTLGVSSTGCCKRSHLNLAEHSSFTAPELFSEEAAADMGRDALEKVTHFYQVTL